MRRLLAATLILFSTCVWAADQNYCHDPEAEAEWQVLIQKFPGDQDVHALHALRIGLCVKVDRGDLTVEQATAIFEKARKTLVELSREEEARKGGKGGAL